MSAASAAASGRTGNGVQGAKPPGLASFLITTADDFGLSSAVNEAVEQAHEQGVLTAASLMVAGPAADEAVRIAKRCPRLGVGLHLVLVDGPPSSPAPRLLDAEGRFGADQAWRGVRYAFDPRLWAPLRREVEAQFAAYAATGLALDHADAHRHMHLHPLVGALLIGIGRRHGLRALRVPREPPAVLRACGEPGSLGVLAQGTRLLRWQARRAGLTVSDQVFGLYWTGRMTGDRLRRLARHLPPGVSEVYFHPATHRDAAFARLMPDYAPESELAGLVAPETAAALAAAGITLGRYGDLVSSSGSGG